MNLFFFSFCLDEDFVFLFCFIDEDLPILFSKEWHLFSVFLFCDDTNVNTAIIVHELEHKKWVFGSSGWTKHDMNF